MEKFIELFVEQFDDQPTVELTADTRFRELEGWTSLVALSILSMIDEEYDVSLTGNEMRGTHTIGELFALVQSKL